MRLLKRLLKEAIRMNFETIKKNYVRGLWNEQMVRMAVRKGVITQEQYKEITGIDYAK